MASVMRPHVGVVARAHVLEVHDERAEPAQGRLGGREPAAVEAPHGKPGGAVPLAADPDLVLGGAGDAVLGREERGEARARQRADHVHRVAEVAGDRRLMREEPDAPAAEETGLAAGKHIEAGENGGHQLL